VLLQVDKLIEWFTARPKKNMEHYQLLHYEAAPLSPMGRVPRAAGKASMALHVRLSSPLQVGQQYKEHHDFIYDQAVMSQGTALMHPLASV